MSIIPKRNLPPDAEPWGRSVDERITGIEKTSAKNRRDTSNSQSAINSTVTKLSEQVAAIDGLTQRLAEQQAQLSDQVDQLEALVNAQNFPVTTFTEQLEFVLTPGTGAVPEILRTNIAVPAGFSRAVVYTTASITAYNTTGVMDFLYLGAGINGSRVGKTAYLTVEADRTVSLSRAATAVLSGLTDNIYVTAHAGTLNGLWTSQPTSNNISLSTMVLFLR